MECTESRLSSTTRTRRLVQSAGPGGCSVAMRTPLSAADATSPRLNPGGRGCRWIPRCCVVAFATATARRQGRKIREQNHAMVARAHSLVPLVLAVLLVRARLAERSGAAGTDANAV